MQPIFNKSGKVEAWLKGSEIYNPRGYNVGYVINNATYNLKSKYIGTLQKSFFRDLNGNVVTFLNGAKSGPVLPSFKSLPVKPVLKSTSPHKVVPSPPPPPTIKPRWSKIDWDEFIK